MLNYKLTCRISIMPTCRYNIVQATITSISRFKFKNVIIIDLWISNFARFRCRLHDPTILPRTLNQWIERGFLKTSKVDVEKLSETLLKFKRIKKNLGFQNTPQVQLGSISFYFLILLAFFLKSMKSCFFKAVP